MKITDLSGPYSFWGEFVSGQISLKTDPLRHSLYRCGVHEPKEQVLPRVEETLLLIIPALETVGRMLIIVSPAPVVELWRRWS